MQPMVAVRSGSSFNTRNQSRRPTPLRHPTPDLHALLSAFPHNISRLEQSAEELSAGGSDIGEEIRKMNEEQKIRSRQNSVQSGQEHEIHAGGSNSGSDDEARRRGSVGVLHTTESRAGSSTGYSIVDVNGTARGGGYSPAGFVTSPVESSRSGSWSHASMPRKASTTGSSRLAQMVEPVQEGRPLDSPLAPGNASYTPSRQTSHASRASQSSFAQHYDRIANEIDQSRETVPPLTAKHSASMPIAMHDLAHPAESITPPIRPRSADTFQEAQNAFRDFDGVHYAPGDDFVELDESGNEVRRVSARSSSGRFSLDAASLLLAPRQQPITYAAPPPGENMVYYPAPVPRMLNLPKRLSQLPSATVQAKRRTQLLGQLSQGARQSAPWLSQANLSEAGRSQRSGSGSTGELQAGQRGMLNERMSIANFNNLPPQLRASVFFEHQTVVQDVEVKHGSAVATLDNILAASATAPVSAFTDHPFAGDVRKSVYMAEHSAAKRSTTSFETEGAAKTSTKRQSSMGRLLRRTSGGKDLEDAMTRNGSRSSMLAFSVGDNKSLHKRKSQMSLGGVLEREPQAGMTLNEDADEPSASTGLISQSQNADPGNGHDNAQDTYGRTASSSRPGGRVLGENEQIEEDFRDAEADEDVNEGEPVFAPPTTLLAELQVRKMQQKSRNRTAATAFPNGMHSTLLQMDAVDEITRRKRQRHKVALAWEDPNAEELADDDDNVPLGMLYPGKDGLINRKVGDGKDWDRPLGLMAKRELEDNEPLSSRKNRLQGLPPDHGRKPAVLPSVSNLHLAGQLDAPLDNEAVDENAGETLVQRMRRVKSKDALDTAIADVAAKVGERPISTFTDDVLSQFGGLDIKDSDVAGKQANGIVATSNEQLPEPAEETLGQRRIRLQREREAAGESNQSRPLPQSAGIPNAARSRNHVPAEGTLLHANAQAQSRQKQALLNTNMRSSSYGLNHPLVNPQPQSVNAMHSGLLGQSQNNAALAGGFAGGKYNNGLGGINASTQSPQQGMYANTNAPSFTMNGTNGYFASPTMGMQFHRPPAGQQSQPMASGMGINPFAFPSVNSGMGMGIPAAYANHGYMLPQQQQQQQQQYHQQMMAKPMTYGAGAMGMGPAGFGPEDFSLDPRQRAQIDQWRMSVAP